MSARLTGSGSIITPTLQDYAPGLHEGQRLARGDPIGTVGSTGNANPAGPHLHFAIHRMGNDERWWQGRAINPYPLLAAPARPLILILLVWAAATRGNEESSGRRHATLRQAIEGGRS
jgi:hypothetical protein